MTMDTEEKYLNDEFYVILVSEEEKEKHDPAWHNLPDNVKPAKIRNEHPFGCNPKIDGWLTFFDRELLEEDKPYKHGTIPFRDVNKNGKWFAFPDREKGKRHPVWKWKNADGKLSEITLEPSIGLGDNFHCWVKGGVIEWA